MSTNAALMAYGGDGATDIRKYEVILKAAECRSLTRAGEAFGYTQSGVSHMIHAVEREFGFRIFQRAPRGVTISPDGRRVLPILREIVRQNERLIQTIDEIGGLVHGTLRIGTFTSIGVHWLPSIIKSFLHDWPNIEIEISEGGAAAIERALNEGRNDLALMSAFEGRGYECIPLCTDPLYAILPPDDPCAAQRAFPIRDFNGRDFIMISSDRDYDARLLLAKYSVTPHIRFSPEEDHTVYAMVEQGLGASILPGLVLRGFRGHAAALPLEPEEHRTLALCAPSFETLSPAARRFAQYVKRMVAPDGSLHIA